MPSQTRDRFRPPKCEHCDPLTAVKVETRSDFSDAILLRTYRCAVNSCRKPLGWTLEVRRKSTLVYGDGECVDPRVEQAFRYHNHLSITAGTAGVAAIAVVLAAVFAVFSALDTNHPVVWLTATGFCTAAAAAAIVGFVSWRKRGQIPEPDFHQALSTDAHNP